MFYELFSLKLVRQFQQSRMLQPTVELHKCTFLCIM